MSSTVRLVADGPDRWRIDRHDAMRVPGIVFASTALLPQVREDQALQQVVNVATLPGIVGASYAMPDVHWGYGFPIGGVAATDVDAGGVVSPGGVGFDISCGVRLLAAPLQVEALRPVLRPLMDELGRTVPKGMGRGAVLDLDRRGLDDVLRHGAAAPTIAAHRVPGDLEHCEDGGVLPGAEPADVSDRAVERGLGQLGSLGSGNHFLEVQVVDEVLDGPAAAAFGLAAGQVCVMIHCGSRGLGHQICTDHVHTMLGAMARHGITVPDKQLACAPVGSPEGRRYLGAMAAAANYGRANRQLLAEATRRAFEATAGTGDLRLVYDVSHNLAKIETHIVDGVARRLCVHRKGATRALPPGHADLPAALAATGQPVLVPGSMGTASWVCVGIDPGGAFSSTCHGAGRTMSRHAAKRLVRGGELRRRLEASGIQVRAGSMSGLAEETPEAYKDVDEVVATCERAGLARRVARLRPLGVVKG